MSTSEAFLDFQLWSLRATWPPLLLLGSALIVALASPYLWLSVLAVLGVFVLSLDSAARLREFVRLRAVFLFKRRVRCHDAHLPSLSAPP